METGARDAVSQDGMNVLSAQCSEHLPFIVKTEWRKGSTIIHTMEHKYLISLLAP